MKYTKDLLPQYKIGKRTYGLPKVLAWQNPGKLEIGAYCSISSGVKILLGGEHLYDRISTYPFDVTWPYYKGSKKTSHPKTKGDVIIGNDVWIGQDATVLSGVHIEDGAVIGAGALVTRYVAPYSIVAGNPAKLIKFRFDWGTIGILMTIKWWDWEDSVLERYVPIILNGNIGEFIEEARKDGLYDN